MKKTILTSLIMLIAVMMIGQTSERTSAFNYHRYGKLDLAKASIDKAAQNEKTIMDAKTWFYRGNIYYDIGVSFDSNFRKLDPDPFGVAYESYMRAKELDTKGEFTDDIQKYTIAVGEGYYNTGVINYNESKFKEAALNFEKAFTVSKAVNRLDTSALVNAAVSAAQGSDLALSKRYYKELIDMGVQKPDIYASLSEIYKVEGDTAMSLQTIQSGRTIFPEDFNLLIAETNIYLATDEKEKAITNLETALKIDNTNPSIFFAVGTIYDQMGDLEKAISAYVNAINVCPDEIRVGLSAEEAKKIKGEPISVNRTTNEYGVTEQWVYDDQYLYLDNGKLTSWQELNTTSKAPSILFSANYNLGALYVNQAADILDKANDLPLDAVAQYDQEKAKADEMLAKSLPYLEKSLELMPDDVNTMVSLKEIYTRLGMTEKLEMINSKLQK